ncbi:putative cop9 signalosome subunit 6 [Phaeomoniella chlamydospora]|uniref:Putative cop9 signalosome subunit 6 n=1 Tax=Phaeomoniella chlamydospora TaxID=158046 RepID=A0A0G2DWE6_PHACM|nr:putative cop9 signalosome subunit 6 [Phaeomoniella chlamydospora]
MLDSVQLKTRSIVDNGGGGGGRQRKRLLNRESEETEFDQARMIILRPHPRDPAPLARNGQNVILHSDWFEERLKQHKDVHKQPSLELVGWFTVAPESGPLPVHLPIHRQILNYNESPVLLAFHPSALATIGSNTTGKLPLTLYETTEDAESTPNNGGKRKDSSAMQLDSDEPEPSPLRFRVLPYTVETEETEMIGVDYVAKGGGNASAIDPSGPGEPSSRKGKQRSHTSEEQNTHDLFPTTLDAKTFLSSEDDDLIANLTTRLNSVRMLQSRLSLLQKFINSLPPSYLSSASEHLTPTSPSPSSLSYLRQISALVTRLSLLTPVPTITPSDDDNSIPPTQAEADLTAQSNDANLTALLSLLGRNIQGANELGRKFSAAESVKQTQKQSGRMMKAAAGMCGAGRFEFMTGGSSGDGMVEPDFEMT